MGNGQVKSPNYMLCMDIIFLGKNEKLRVLNPERMTLNPKSVSNQMGALGTLFYFPWPQFFHK